MRELLRGVVDMHIHGTPSIAPRIDTRDFLREMDQAGYRAVGLKEHFMPTTGLAHVLNRCRPSFETEVTGSLVLNNACGGLNVTAVDAACAMGARQIFFPTVSARNHCDYVKKVGTFGGGALSIPEKPIFILNGDGTLVDEVFPIIEYLSRRKEIVLSMGHMSPAEMDMLIPFAVSSGVEKIVVDHPYFIIGAEMKQVEGWARQGAYINFTCSSLEGLGQNGRVPLRVLEETLALVPEDKLVISTDYGQLYNGSPVEGMYQMIKTLINDLKVSENRVKQMTHSIPAKLLGIV